MKKPVTSKVNFCTLASDRQNIHFDNGTGIATHYSYSLMQCCQLIQRKTQAMATPCIFLLTTEYLHTYVVQMQNVTVHALVHIL